MAMEKKACGLSRVHIYVHKQYAIYYIYLWSSVREQIITCRRQVTCYLEGGKEGGVTKYLFRGTAVSFVRQLLLAVQNIIYSI